MSRSPSVLPEGRAGDLVLALLLGVVAFVALYATAPLIGYARDEGFYFDAAASYGRWLKLLLSDPTAAMSRRAIDGHFAINAEHPSLMKLLFAVSELTLHERFGLIEQPGLAYRVPGMLLGAVATGVTAAWAMRLVSRSAGLVAGVLLLLMPRWFHHAHLACFDVAIATLVLLCTACYRRAIHRKDWASALQLGVCYGLALETKHNAWWLPLGFLIHLLLVEGRHWLAASRSERWVTVRPLVCMIVVGPIVLVMLWPWLWYDTVERLGFWVRFHLNHDYYNMEFLGRTYHRPPMPWQYPWLMTAGTVPGTTLVLSLLGMGICAWHALRSSQGLERKRKVLVYAPLDSQSAPAVSPAERPRTTLPPAAWDDRRSTDLLLLLAVLSAYAPWLLPSTPIFGGTKHWLSAYPFLCLFAARGYGFWSAKMRDLFGGGVQQRRFRVLFARSVGSVALLAPPATMTWDSLPWGLSAYTPIVGGTAGAATLGLNRTFWGYTTLSVAEVLHELAPNGATVYVHDTAIQSYRMHQRDGAIAHNLVPTLNIAQSQLALYHHEPHMERVEYQIWEAYGTTQPAAVACHDGVPVVWVYQRP